jgi:two-component system, NarL family, response regulator NreC
MTVTMPRTTILIADDHTVLRQGLRRILDGDPTLQVVGEAGDGRAAVALAEKLRPSVVLMDIGLPLMNGIEATSEVHRMDPRTGVIILSMHADAGYLRRSLEAGARGYLLKDSEDLDVVRAIKAVAAGGSFFSPAMAALMREQLLAPQGAARVDELDVLTQRERQVLQLVAEGKSNKEIATIMDLGVSTVETHRKHVMEKLNLHNTADLVRFAIRHRIVVA